MKLTNLLKLMVGGILCLTSLSSLAASGWCTATLGTRQYTFNFVSTMTDPLQNKAGTELNRTYNWTSPGIGYQVGCEGESGNAVYYKTTVPGLMPGVEINGLHFFSINKYLQVATEVFIGGNLNKYVATPFENVSNNNTTYTNVFNSGSTGYISLYFASPFVGVVNIPPTKVMDIYGSRTSGSFGGTPMASVTMTGTVTVPQSCDINAGQIIDVKFGNIYATDIKTKGANAAGYTPKVINMTLACNNISEGVNISLSFNGESSTGDPTALKTSNDDIGVRILDATGSTVSPNSGRLPVTMNYAAQTGTSSMTLAPMNVTGNEPPVGDFNATATIRAEMQ
jgi:type 1 fimbria pilin